PGGSSGQSRASPARATDGGARTAEALGVEPGELLPGGQAEGLKMPARAMLLHLACVVTGLGVCLAGALMASTGPTAPVAPGGMLFALGAAVVGWQGWHAVKRVRGGRQECNRVSRPTVPRRRPATG